MNFAWTLGFGWIPIILSVTFAFLGYKINGFLSWLLYGMALLSVLYMIAQYYKYNSSPWRKVHFPGMIIYAGLAGDEAGQAKREGRPVNRYNPCEKLAEIWLGVAEGRTALKMLTMFDNGIQNYLTGILEQNRSVILDKIPEEKQDEAFQYMLGIVSEINLSPQVIFCKVIEKTYGSAEAARYCLALFRNQAS